MCRLWIMVSIFFLVNGGLITEATIDVVGTSLDRKDSPGLFPEKHSPEPFLNFKVNYVYRSRGNGEFKILTDGSRLRSGDHYKIIFTPSEDCYVYIFQIDSAGKVFQLFPMESFGGVVVNNFNPVQGGKTYYIPAEDKSFVLDDQTGQEKIYFLASRQRDREVEEKYQLTLQSEHQKVEQQEQVTQTDQLLISTMEARGVASISADSDKTENVTWQEHGQTFSVLQQYLENMCDGCVYVITFTHQ